MPKFTVVHKTEYDIEARTAEEARRRWLDSDWDWKFESEPESCLIYDEQGTLVWEP